MKRSGVCAPIGYSAAGVACGLKKNGNKDLAMIVSQVPANAAGMFTTNVVKGHSLQWSRRIITSGTARAVVINSGCANACVGPDGDKDAEKMASLAAAAIGCEPEEVLLGSTGVIGFRLDMEKIANGIQHATQQLSPSGGYDAVCAIMTTDTFPKEAQTSFEIDGATVTIGGIAKGSGMIHPNMATMISVLTTDAAISSTLLDKALKKVVNRSFNRVSVDGDTSVCDKVVLLANGQAENTPITEDSKSWNDFLDALETVAVHLSKMLARDGEGATKLIEIQVDRVDTEENAHKILNAIAKSPLVKTAFFGQDANWGRILTAAGYSGAQFDPNKVNVWLGSLLVCENGTALLFDEDEALSILKQDTVKVRLDFTMGSVSDRMWTCDFSYDYVKINGSYRT